MSSTSTAPPLGREHLFSFFSSFFQLRSIPAWKWGPFFLEGGGGGVLLAPPVKKLFPGAKQQTLKKKSIFESSSIYEGHHSLVKLSLGAFTLLTSRFLKSRHFDPTIYTCAKNREVSVSRNFTIFWLVVRMCNHRLQCMHSCMQRMQYAWGPRISIHVSKSAHS